MNWRRTLATAAASVAMIGSTAAVAPSVAAADASLGDCSVSQTGANEITVNVNVARFGLAPVSIIRNGRWVTTTSTPNNGSVSATISGSGEDTITFRQTKGGVRYESDPCSAASGEGPTAIRYSRGPLALFRGLVGYSFGGRFSSTDPDGGPITFSAVGLPPGVTVSASGEILGEPTAAGSYRGFRVTATDNQGFTSEYGLNFIDVLPAIATCTVESQGADVALSINREERIGFSRAPFSIRRDGRWAETLSVGETRTVVSGSVDDEWRVRQTNAGRNYESAPCQVIGGGDNRPPSIADPGTIFRFSELEPDRFLPIRLDASDPDGDPLEFVPQSVLGGTAQLNSAGVISGSYGAAGTVRVPVTVRDSSGAEDSITLTIVFQTARQFCDATTIGGGQVRVDIASPDLPLAGISIFRNGRYVRTVPGSAEPFLVVIPGNAGDRVFYRQNKNGVVKDTLTDEGPNCVA